MPGEEDGARELGRFPRSRRERLRPAVVGLPVGPRRRVAGPRREEVARLAQPAELIEQVVARALCSPAAGTTTR